MTDTPKFPRKPGETSKDYRERLSRLAGRNYKGKETRQDADIQAEGDAKLNPTQEQIAPKTEAEKEAAKTGAEAAREAIKKKTPIKDVKKDKDGFLRSQNLGRNTLKILKTAAALTQIPTTVLRTGLTISGLGGRM
jgi:hypothetical protein